MKDKRVFSKSNWNYFVDKALLQFRNIFKLFCQTLSETFLTIFYHFIRNLKHALMFEVEVSNIFTCGIGILQHLVGIPFYSKIKIKKEKKKRTQNGLKIAKGKKEKPHAQPKKAHAWPYQKRRYPTNSPIPNQIKMRRNY